MGDVYVVFNVGAEFNLLKCCEPGLLGPRSYFFENKANKASLLAESRNQGEDGRRLVCLGEQKCK